MSLPVREPVQPDSIDCLTDINFEFYTNNKTKICNNIITFDIETSNGYAIRPTNKVLSSAWKVIGWDPLKYNEKISDDNGNMVDNPDYDPDYHKTIEQAEPVGLLYHWQLAISDSVNGNYVFCGRDWEDFENFVYLFNREMRRQAVYQHTPVDLAAEYWAIDHSDRTAITCDWYIHNAGFEFQFLRNVWAKPMSRKNAVFAREPRKPMKFRIKVGGVSMCIRDSVVLTQKTLHTWCIDENLPVQKRDEPAGYYDAVRTPETLLDTEEVRYAINDVVCMIYGIEKYREKYSTLKKIPLTQTGQVRIRCRESVGGGDWKWQEKCHQITQATNFEQFKELTHLFQGGWVHANKMYADMVMKDVVCFDFASSYPAVMCSRRFPVSVFIDTPVTDFDIYRSEDINTGDHRWYALIKWHGVCSKLDASYWSSSKVTTHDDTDRLGRPIKKPDLVGGVTDNGRIVYAYEMQCYMSDLDFDTFVQCYDYDSYEVISLKVADAGYLSPALIKTILEYFKYKTSLKGVSGNESIYSESKQFINSIYGCAVTKIITDSIAFDTAWERTPVTEEDYAATIGAMKESQQFITYAQGVWVTAWARHNLFDFVIALDKRVCYCDTDSIKGIFTDEDIKFVDNYNKGIEQIENTAATSLKIDSSLWTATTAKGKTKRLGIMEREEDCNFFKTIGAKRYAADHGTGEIECTIAGLPKSAGSKRIKKVDDLKDGLLWNTIDSEKLAAIYNDDQPLTEWVDRDGCVYTSFAKYGICLKPVPFEIGAATFMEFLSTLATGRINRYNEIFNSTPDILLW